MTDAPIKKGKQAKDINMNFQEQKNGIAIPATSEATDPTVTPNTTVVIFLTKPTSTANFELNIPGEFYTSSKKDIGILTSLLQKSFLNLATKNSPQ